MMSSNRIERQPSPQQLSVQFSLNYYKSNAELSRFSASQNGGEDSARQQQRRTFFCRDESKATKKNDQLDVRVKTNRREKSARKGEWYSSVWEATIDQQYQRQWFLSHHRTIQSDFLVDI